MAAPTIGTGGTVAGGGFGDPVTVTLPTHATDDILVIPFIAWEPNNTVGGVYAAPSGWSKAISAVIDSGGNTVAEWCLFWKRATSAAESNPAVTMPSGWDTGNDTCRAGRAYVVSGCITTGDPFDDVQTSAAHTTDDQAVPALTVSGSDRLVVHFMASSDNGPEVTAATGYTLGGVAITTTGSDAAIQAIYKTAASSTSADAVTILAGTSTYRFIGVSFKPPGASGTSGSGAPSLARHTAAGSGTSTPPPVTGTSATTLTRHTAAGAGSTGTEGSSATTLVRHTGAGAGSTGTTGTSATTLVRHTAAGAGSTGTEGTSATTLARVTAAGTGTTTAPGVTSGSGSPTLTRHTAAGAGTTTIAPVTGTGSPTCTRHTAAGVGTTTSPSASGSGAVTLVRHVAAGSGVITGPSVTGSGTLLLARHSASGVGVGPGTATMTKQRSAVGGMERDVRPSERRSILDLRRITQNKPDITVGVGEPAQAALGDFWFNLTVMKYWNGTEWVEI